MNLKELQYEFLFARIKIVHGLVKLSIRFQRFVIDKVFGWMDKWDKRGIAWVAKSCDVLKTMNF